MLPRNAVIVGAGIGGLAAAIALKRSGWDVRVFERAESPRELGFALLLAPNAMHALAALGIADAARQGGAIATSGEMRRPDGTVLRRFDTAAARAALGEDAVCILRPVLHGALLDAVGRDAIGLSSEAVGFASIADGVTVTFANGQTAGGDVLIGADGVGSAIRRQLHPDEPAPRSSGLFAIRGVARDVAHHLGGTSGAQYFGRGLEAGVARAGEREVYWFLSLRVDRVDRTGDPTTLARQCAAMFHEPFRAIVQATPADDLRVDDLFEREPIADWGRGPATLVGDAAHPMLPHAGQGAAQAIEDAVALGAVLRDAGDAAAIHAALRRYEAVRSSRTRTISDIARRNARMGSLTNAFGCWLRDQAIRFIPQSVILKSLVDLGTPVSVDGRNPS
jgi:2-polyprenyl-6-methoxyphenol hydroxylase-like FAD-dependent oxidoreductase